MIRLLEMIVAHLTLSSVELFDELSVVESTDEMFDEFFEAKRDLGKVLRKATQLIGFDRVFGLLMEKLEAELSLYQIHSNNQVILVNIHGILTSIEHLTRLVKAEESDKL